MESGRFVQASDSEVGSILRDLVATALGGGARIHPGARIREESGSLSVHCADPSADGEILFDIPREQLIPVDGAKWSDAQDKIELIEPPEGLTPLQGDLLDLHIALYNATVKLPWTVANQPTVALRDHPDLVTAIQAFRPTFALSPATVAEAFLETRTYSLHPQSAGSRVAHKTVLMTLVDFMNHHPAATGLNTDDRAMTIPATRPLGTDECLVRYGRRRDVIDLALHYGYVDAATTVALSAPVTVLLGAWGRLEVSGVGMKVKSPLDPPRIEVDGDSLRLSHLTFQADHPRRLLAVLRLAVLGYAARQGVRPDEAERAVDDVLSQVIGANLGLLTRIRQSAGMLTRKPVSKVIAGSAARQAGIIRNVTDAIG
jgi:hypothetical protein